MSFKLTEEQQAIVDSLYTDNDVVKINAYAGTGKTSSLIELVKEIRKKDQKCSILYLVFNKGMVQDSKNKFDALDLNVDCYTTHSFSLRRFMAVKQEQINIKASIDFNLFMKIKNKPEYKSTWITYKDIVELFNAYCLTFDNLDTFTKLVVLSGDKYNIKSSVSEKTAQVFKEMYKSMIKNNEYLHNMYLKEYSCECKDKIRGYKYILLDEAQDLNPFVLNIINRTVREKLYIVGDIRQKIYSFNGAVNSMAKYDGLDLTLSTSFRFNDEVCKLANELLDFRYNDFKKGSIKNAHNIVDVDDKTKKTILFRRNSTLFEYAVNLINNLENVKVKFMDVVNGNNSDSFEDAFSEMLYFYYKLLESKNIDKANEFKSKFRFEYSKTIDTFIKIAEKQNTNFYNYLCRNKIILPLDLCKFFNFFLLNEMQIIDVLEKVRASEDNLNADREFYLVTSHRSKGLEWSWVKIADDEWSLKSDDEVNLLYVACTRAKHKLEHTVVDRLLEDAKVR